jgi:hypothetical protein
VLNRLYGGAYDPTKFWIDLGLIFKNSRKQYPSTTSSYRIFADTLRELAYHLYVRLISLIIFRLTGIHDVRIKKKMQLEENMKQNVLTIRRCKKK